MKNFLKSSLCASLDILGFQDEIKRAYKDNREEMLICEIEAALKSAAETLEDMAARNPQILTTLKFFTDNLIVGYHYITPNWKSQMSHLCELLADFQLDMACKGMFIRGGISIGTLASDERMVFGDCLVKAHELEAKIARNPRVVLDSCFSQPGVDNLKMSAFRLMRDVDGFFFINYLSALIQIELKPLPGPYLNEDRLKIHKGQVERLLEENRHDPNIWSKYFWVANYHDAFCEQVQRRQYRINESLLRAQPIGLVSSLTMNVR